MSISPSVKTNRLGQSSEIPHGGQPGVSADCIYNAESSQRVVGLRYGGCWITARANGCHSLWPRDGKYVLTDLFDELHGLMKVSPKFELRLKCICLQRLNPTGFNLKSNLR